MLPGGVASTPEEAKAVAAELGGHVVVKAQVHAGGRGKAGGVKLADNPDQTREVSQQILKLKIKGWPVRKVLVGKAAAEILTVRPTMGSRWIAKSRQNVVICSSAGGIDIEEVAAQDAGQDRASFSIEPGYQGLTESRGAGDLAEGLSGQRCDRTPSRRRTFW